MEVPDEIQNRYLERRKLDLEACFSNLEDEKYEELERVGHKLKGNGATFGHTELAEIGVVLEKAAHEKNIQDLEKILNDFSTWVHDHIN